LIELQRARLLGGDRCDRQREREEEDQLSHAAF
jgi:hypothetical protein